MTFEELVQMLPACGPVKLNLSAARPDVSFVTESRPGFVAPTLSARDDIPVVHKSDILIVSASGAVGKTTLSKELAYRTQAPRWDLALVKSVAQGSIDGMISQAFGDTEAGTLKSRIQGGSYFLVVDALDEALLKSKENPYADFIADLAHLSRGEGGVKFVLFGRTQTAETTWLLLHDFGISAALWEIDFFDEEQANLYIDHGMGPDHARTVPFLEVRNLLLGKMRDAVRANRSETDARSEIRAFVGYAPVLSAVADYMKLRRNWPSLKQEIMTMGVTPGARAGSAMSILADMIQRMLERERQEKVLHNIVDPMEPTAKEVGWSDWKSLYSAREQSARVLAKALGAPLPEDSRPKLPRRLATLYEELLRPWVEQHPFLRDAKHLANSVFEAYLFSRVLVSDLGEMERAVELRLGSQNYLPNRLLAEFYLQFSAGVSQPVVAASHIGFLYDSVLSSETPDQWIGMFLDGSPPDDSGSTPERDRVDGGFVFARPGDPQETSVDFVSWAPPDATVAFGRQLRNADIVLPCEVMLGAANDEFHIGPGVEIWCNKLTIASRSLVVGAKAVVGDAEDGAVTLRADECSSAVSEKPTVHTSLAVNWPGSLAFPWTEYHSEGLAGEQYKSNPQMASAFMRFRRIVMTLQSHKKGQLARVRAKVESQRVLQGQLGSELLRKLVGDGILTLVGSFYYWNPDRAAELVGVSWQQLRGGRTSDTLTDYLQAFLAGRREAPR